MSASRPGAARNSHYDSCGRCHNARASVLRGLGLSETNTGCAVKDADMAKERHTHPCPKEDFLQARTCMGSTLTPFLRGPQKGPGKDTLCPTLSPSVDGVYEHSFGHVTWSNPVKPAPKAPDDVIRFLTNADYFKQA